jgi:hypothetical protein
LCYAPPYGGVFCYKKPPPVIGLNRQKQTTQKEAKTVDKIIELFKVSGFAAIISVTLTALISNLFNVYFEKRRQRQHFINEILPERMRAHGAILETLAVTYEKTVHACAKQTTKISDEILKYAKEFHSVYIRNTIWLDKAVQDHCGSIHELLISTVADKTGKNHVKKRLNAEECANMLTSFVVYYAFIQKRIISTSGIPLLEKYLSGLAVKKAGKKPFQPPDASQQAGRYDPP